MNRHGASVSTHPVGAKRAMDTATTDRDSNSDNQSSTGSGGGGARRSRGAMRLRELKARLFHTLQRRHPNGWKLYWTAFQRYLLARLALNEFHAIAERLLGNENIGLHNSFVVALLQDPKAFEGEDDASSPHGSTDRESATGCVEIKSEPPETTPRSVMARVHDTESAHLLMGLGTFVSHAAAPPQENNPHNAGPPTT